VPDPNHFKAEITIAKLRKYKSQDSDLIPAELIQVGGEILLSAIHKLILFGIRKNCLISGKSLLLYQFTKRVIKLDCDNYRERSLLSTSYKIVSNIFSRLKMKLLRIISVGFDIKDQLLIRLFAFV
jgi:hypothetical protein